MLTTMVPDPAAYMHVHDVKPEYALEKGKGNVGFTLMTNKDINVDATVYDANNKSVGTVKQTLNASTEQVVVPVISAPGVHTLKLIASSQDGRENFQEAKALNLTGEAAEHDFDFVFPEGVKQYDEGTKVLQPKNDKVYECKPFPFSGWCSQYSPTSNGYEPGVGSSWMDAWTELN